MSKAAMKPAFTDRIDAALAHGRLSFLALAEALYLDRRSWRPSQNGGPPGCFMTLSATLRRNGYRIAICGRGPQNRFVYPRIAPLRQTQNNAIVQPLAKTGKGDSDGSPLRKLPQR